MMASLDTPLEALAFFAVVNNIWTWIAAAVSFWRIKVTTIKDGYDLLEELTEPELITTGSVKETVGQVKEVVMETVTGVWEPSVCNDGVTKGEKLTMYYEVDVDGGECGDDGELTDVSYGLGDCGEWWEKWEKVRKMRNGDEYWYRYVDLTVVNGNVVRFWDDNGVF